MDKTALIAEIAKSIDIPDSAYERAESRYKDLGEWFSRPESRCAAFDPHIYSQGSFRLGTVVQSDEYDLDFGCRLRCGVSKSTHSQRDLKMLVGTELEEYRRARSIQEDLKEKARCWRLQYADKLSFHMDGVPSIPEDVSQQLVLQQRMIKAGFADMLAQRVARHAGAITDNRLANYSAIHPDWLISNSEGFAVWFESRMKLATASLRIRASEAFKAQIDDLPAREWKLPLQRSVQILKRHRDMMFADRPDLKPISVIITTLAARAYRGEDDLGEALQRILNDMGGQVAGSSPRVPNPVNPLEDFADRWATAEGRAKRLEENFWAWLAQARVDFELLASSNDTSFISKQALQKYGARLDPGELRTNLGITAPAVIVSRKTHRIEDPPRPWSRQ